jgi:hypothetical protein
MALAASPGQSGRMGMLIRLLLTKFLPARLAWIVAAFVFARALAGRRERAAGTTTGRRERDR